VNYERRRFRPGRAPGRRLRLLEARLGDEALERRQLLRLAQKYNYIPKSVEDAYEQALWREYTKARGDRAETDA